jgi:hypothetical protein
VAGLVAALVVGKRRGFPQTMMPRVGRGGVNTAAPAAARTRNAVAGLIIERDPPRAINRRGAGRVGASNRPRIRSPP